MLRSRDLTLRANAAVPAACGNAASLAFAWSVCSWGDAWTEHVDQHSLGYAGGDSTTYDLADAKAACLNLGESVCAAITCATDACTVRASSNLGVSTSGETTHVASCSVSPHHAADGLGSTSTSSSSGRRRRLAESSSSSSSSGGGGLQLGASNTTSALFLPAGSMRGNASH